jgi:hypothetical protein
MTCDSRTQTPPLVLPLESQPLQHHPWQLAHPARHLLVPQTFRGEGTKVQSTMFTPAGKLCQQSLRAANVCTTTSGHLFLTDRVRKQRYLVDTGSDLCVFPRKLLPGAQGAHRLHPVRGQWDHHPHIWMDLTEPEPGTAPRIHVAVRAS